jgi:hypothetical protein
MLRLWLSFEGKFPEGTVEKEREKFHKELVDLTRTELLTVGATVSSSSAYITTGSLDAKSISRYEDVARILRVFEGKNLSRVELRVYPE